MTDQQLLEALSRCVGATTFDQEKSCVSCPLYEDHYCVDTLVSLIREKIGQAERAAKVNCSQCVHCEKSCYAGFWHCEAWDQEISMAAHDPEKYFCAEGERREDE